MATVAESDPKSNLAIVLVPGSFSPPHCYTHVSRQLSTQSYAAVQVVPLMSACKKDEQKTPPATLEADAFYIREVLQALLSRGLDIIMVMNSYGGFPGTEAIKDLPNRNKLNFVNKPGQQGAIVGMIYLSSYLPFPGDNLRSMMGELLFEPLKSGDPGNYMYLPDQAGPGIFNEWNDGQHDKDIEYWFGQMTTHSSDSFDGKISHNLWNSDFQGQVVYMIGENDVIIPPSLGESMIDKVNKIQDGKVKVKRHDAGGHCMHVTMPEKVVEAIDEVIASLMS